MRRITNKTLGAGLAAANTCYLSILFTCVAISCHLRTLACSLLFLVLTPVVFSDPREEMRTLGHGLCWCIISVAIMAIIQKLSQHVVIVSLVAFGALLFIVFCINRYIKNRNIVFRRKIVIGTSNRVLFSCLYICLGLWLLAAINIIFLHTWYESGIYLFVSLLIVLWVVLEWNKNIMIQDNTIVVQIGRKIKSVPVEAITKVERVPFLGYRAKDQYGKELFIFRMTMQNVPGLIAILPPKLRPH